MSGFFSSGKGYRFYTKATLICVMMVVLVGSLVKVSDSGMGCPDWPKCYGHLVPPFSANEVIFQKNQYYFAGQMIIDNNKLWSANKNFTSVDNFDSKNWTIYNKHNYTIYNPIHTLIEYINRLATVVLGIFALLMLIYSFAFLKTKKIYLAFSIGVIVLIGFEAWLGRLVVDSALSPLKISIHLYAAFLLVLIMSLALAISGKPIKINSNLLPKKLLITGLLILMIQLFLGTQLREVFDEFYARLKLPREHWIEQAGLKFIIHRSFSLIYLLIIILLSVNFYKNKTQLKSVVKFQKLLLLICAFEIISGVIMAYLNVPRFIQPLHVFFSSALLLNHSFLVFISIINLNKKAN